MDLTPLIRAALRSWPFANGQGRLVDKSCRYASFPSGRVTCRTTDGFDIDVFGFDHIGRHLLLSGQFDRAGVEMLLKFAEPGARILDIGANIGYVSCCLLARIPHSHVTAIEPHPQTVELLQRNLERFPPERSIVINGALSDFEGTLVLNVNPFNLGASSIDRHMQDSIDVAAISAGRLLSTLDKLDLVKIDVEGHEETVLKASANELNRLKPKAILFEEQERKSHPKGAIGLILSEIGYSVYGIRKSLLGTSLVSIRTERDCGFNDYIALPMKRSIPRKILSS